MPIGAHRCGGGEGGGSPWRRISSRTACSPPWPWMKSWMRREVSASASCASLMPAWAKSARRAGSSAATCVPRAIVTPPRHRHPPHAIVTPWRGGGGTGRGHNKGRGSHLRQSRCWGPSQCDRRAWREEEDGEGLPHGGGRTHACPPPPPRRGGGPLRPIYPHTCPPPTAFQTHLKPEGAPMSALEIFLRPFFCSPAVGLAVGPAVGPLGLGSPR